MRHAAAGTQSGDAKWRTAVAAVVLAATAAVALLSLWPANSYAATTGTGRVAAQTVEFSAALADRTGGDTAASRGSGLIPSPVAPPVYSSSTASLVFDPPASYVSPADRSAAASAATAVPTTFDLRASGALPAVRNQGAYGTCWAFAALDSVESGMLPATPADFSERNLANLSGFSVGPTDGGNSDMATAYLTRESGPVAEADDPYPGSTWLPSPAGLTVRARVREALWLPERTSPLDTDGMKQAIMAYGAVYAGMGWSSSAYRSATASYYSTGIGANHAVTCVGWDDSYPAASFGSTPPGDGAYLVRNSWGTGWGDRGYFWVSYYDDVFPAGPVVYAGAQEVDRTDRVYQYDPLGMTSAYGWGDSSGCMANRFVGAQDETLSSVGFYTRAQDTTYEVRAAATLDGLAAAPVSAHGVLHVAGFHSVDLPRAGEPGAVSVISGEEFVVSVKLVSHRVSCPIAIERPIPGYAPAAASSGQSYVSHEGTSWTDLTATAGNSNVCLKAYVDEAGPGSDPSPDPAPDPPDPQGPDDPTASEVIPQPAILAVRSADASPAGWATSRHVGFSWQSEDGATAYSWSFDRTPRSIPDAIADGNASRAEVRAAGDGAWYFHVRAKGLGGWGPARHLRIRIDARRPVTYALTRAVVAAGHPVKLRVLVVDAASAHARVTVRVYSGRQLVDSVEAGTVRTGRSRTLWVPPLSRGTYVWKVCATDLAGNTQRVTGCSSICAR